MAIGLLDPQSLLNCSFFFDKLSSPGSLWPRNLMDQWSPWHRLTSSCRSCCPSSRLLLFKLLRSHFLLSLGASWGRFWASKMTLGTSKTFILHGEINWFLKNLLFMFEDGLESVLELSWAPFWRYWRSLGRPLGAPYRPKSSATHWVNAFRSSWFLMLTSLCHSSCLVLRF